MHAAVGGLDVGVASEVLGRGGLSCVWALRRHSRFGAANQNQALRLNSPFFQIPFTAIPLL